MSLIPPSYLEGLSMEELRSLPRPSWSEYFMAIAKVVSTRSTCSSRPVGCVIVQDHRILATGYNGPASGAAHCSEMPLVDGQLFCARRVAGVPEKDKQAFCPSIHAEENALRFAEHNHISLAGSTLYTTLAPCLRCMQALVQARVRGIFFELAYASADWGYDRACEEFAHHNFLVYEPAQLGPQSRRKISGTMHTTTSVRFFPAPLDKRGEEE